MTGLEVLFFALFVAAVTVAVALGVNLAETKDKLRAERKEVQYQTKRANRAEELEDQNARDFYTAITREKANRERAETRASAFEKQLTDRAKSAPVTMKIETKDMSRETLDLFWGGNEPRRFGQTFSATETLQRSLKEVERQRDDYRERLTAANKRLGEQNGVTDQLRHYLAALLYQVGPFTVTEKDIGHGFKKRIRFQRNGETGDVRLSLQKLSATENEGGFL